MSLGVYWRGPYQCGRLNKEMIFKLRLELELTRCVCLGVGVLWTGLERQSLGEGILGRGNLKREGRSATCLSRSNSANKFMVHIVPGLTNKRI